LEYEVKKRGVCFIVKRREEIEVDETRKERTQVRKRIRHRTEEGKKKGGGHPRVGGCKTGRANS